MLFYGFIVNWNTLIPIHTAAIRHFVVIIAVFIGTRSSEATQRNQKGVNEN